MVKNYYKVRKNSNVWGVSKWLNNRNTYFGGYGSEDAAAECVKRLKKVDWDKEELPRIRRELREEGYKL